MKKQIVVGCIVTMLIGMSLAPAEAKRSKRPKRIERTIEATYANPAAGIGGVAGANAIGGSEEFPITDDERYVSIEIEDDSGQAVPATLAQNTDPDTASWEIITSICGSAEDVEIEPGLTLRVSVYAISGPTRPTCQGPALGGTIRGVIANLP